MSDSFTVPFSKELTLHFLKTLDELLHEKTKNANAYAKTKAQISFQVTAKLITTFVLITGIVHFPYLLTTKFYNTK